MTTILNEISAVNTLNAFTQMPRQLIADFADHRPGEGAESADEAIFSRERLLKIRAYASQIIELPPEMYGALTALDEAYPQLRLFSFLGDAKTHGYNWRHIEQTILETGIALQRFGGSVVKDGREIIRVIGGMHVMQRIRALNETVLPLGKDDEQACRTIRSLLSRLRQAAVPCKARVANLYKESAVFRETMDNQISPASRRICDTINSIPPLHISAQFGSRSYEKIAAHCKFLENSPIGQGLIADLNNARDENAFMTAIDKIERLLVLMSDRLLNSFERIQSVGAAISDTLSSIQNLDTMLGCVIAYLQEAEKEVAAIKETDRLLIFQNHIRTAVESWEEIDNLSAELASIFTTPI